MKNQQYTPGKWQDLICGEAKEMTEEIQKSKDIKKELMRYLSINTITGEYVIRISPERWHKLFK